MFIQLSDQHIDKVLYNLLLLRQRLGRKVVAELLPHLAVMLRVTDREQGVGLSWCRFVPIALNEESFAGAGSIDVLPCLRGAVGELIRCRAYYSAIFVM